MSMTPRMALVVEDDALQRAVLADLLRSENFDVLECASAEAGELVLGRVGVELSLLITDVVLAGGESGLELADFASSRFPGLKVIVVSGQDRLRVPPGVALVHKPYQLDQMRRLTAS